MQVAFALPNLVASKLELLNVSTMSMPSVSTMSMPRAVRADVIPGWLIYKNAAPAALNAAFFWIQERAGQKLEREIQSQRLTETGCKNA
jgi:hypothetical protein